MSYVSKCATYVRTHTRTHTHTHTHMANKAGSEAVAIADCHTGAELTGKKILRRPFSLLVRLLKRPLDGFRNHMTWTPPLSSPSSSREGRSGHLGGENHIDLKDGLNSFRGNLSQRNGVSYLDIMPVAKSSRDSTKPF